MGFTQYFMEEKGLRSPLLNIDHPDLAFISLCCRAPDHLSEAACTCVSHHSYPDWPFQAYLPFLDPQKPVISSGAHDTLTSPVLVSPPASARVPVPSQHHPVVPCHPETLDTQGLQWNHWMMLPKSIYPKTPRDLPLSLLLQKGVSDSADEQMSSLNFETNFGSGSLCSFSSLDWLIDWVINSLNLWMKPVGVLPLLPARTGCCTSFPHESTIH